MCGRMAPAADAHAMDMSIIKPFLGMQGPQESNPYFGRVGVGLPIRWLIPRPVAVLQQKKTARGKFPRGRLPVSDLRPYPGTSPTIEASSSECHG
jgi:hypothetical protein